MSLREAYLGMPVWYPKKKKHGQLMELDAHNYWRVRFRDGSWGRYSGKRLLNEFKRTSKFTTWELWPQPDKHEAALQAPSVSNFISITPPSVGKIIDQKYPRSKKRNSAGTMWLRLVLYSKGKPVLYKVYNKYTKKEQYAETINS